MFNALEGRSNGTFFIGFIGLLQNLSYFWHINSTFFIIHIGHLKVGIEG